MPCSSGAGALRDMAARARLGAKPRGAEVGSSSALGTAASKLRMFAMLDSGSVREDTSLVFAAAAAVAFKP